MNFRQIFHFIGLNLHLYLFFLFLIKTYLILFKQDQINDIRKMHRL